MEIRQLVELAQQGSTAHYEQLVRAYQRLAITWAWNIVKDFHVAQESRTWKFKNEQWNLIDESKYDYNVEIDAACFKPKFDSEFNLVDIEKEVNSMASLDDCLFSREFSGLTYTIHRATPVEGGGLAVMSSLRESSPGSASSLSMWNDCVSSAQFGDFYRIVNAEASSEGMKLQWFLLSPRKSKWSVYDSTEEIVEVHAASSIVDDKRVSFDARFSLYGPEPNQGHQFESFKTVFEFDEAAAPVSLAEAASLAYREQQQIPNVSYKQLLTGVKLIDGIPTEQRGSIETTSEAEFQQAVADHLQYWRNNDSNSEANQMERQIKHGFVTIRMPAVSVGGFSGFDDEHLKRACARKDLVQVDVSETSVSDAGMEALLALDKLEELDLSKTAVSDESIEVLVQLNSLKRLDVSGTAISAEGASRLTASLKAVEISY